MSTGQPDGQTDARLLHYTFTRHGQHNKTKMMQTLKSKHLKTINRFETRCRPNEMFHYSPAVKCYRRQQTMTPDVWLHRLVSHGKH